MTTHIGCFLRPTLAEMVPNWVAYGFPKREFVRMIMEINMGSATSRGKGTKAARREADALTHKMAVQGLLFSESVRRLKLQRQAFLTTEAAEHVQEARYNHK